MAAVYLGFNALLYAVLAVWCAIAPGQTAAYVGLAPTNPGGESEYLAVYGGLQAGLALYFGLAVFAVEHRHSALWMSVLLYGGLALFRSIAAARIGFGGLGNARFLYCLEIALFLAAAFLVWRGARLAAP